MIKKITMAGLVAALYVVLTLMVSPVAYGPIQFRFGEIMKPLALGGPVYIAGLSVGLFVANLFSPYAGPWEIFFMPVSCLIGGYLTYMMRKQEWAAVIFYAVWISASVGTALHFAMGAPWIPTVLSVGISELPLFLIGKPIMNRIEQKIR